MAHIQLRAPDPFNFRRPDEWSRWKRRYEQFHVAAGLTEEDDARQINTLLYCMGEEAESILDSTNISVEERAVYDSVLRKLDDFFKVRKNVIYERARFNRRCQQDGETAEQFIRELHQLAEDCDYGDRTKEMIRDRLVVGIKDSRLSERLQLDPDLTLDKAEKIIRQSEAVHEQQVELTAGGKLVEPVVTGKGQHTVKTKRGAAKNAAATSLHLKCTRCGKERHPVDKCPARGVTCHKCHKRGHYERQCRSKSISEITNDDIAYLNVLEEDQETSWKAPVKLGETEMYFKIDTGAEVTAISEQTYRKLQNSPPLKKPDKRLLGPSRNPLKVIGQIETKLNYKNKTIKHHVYIVRGLNTNLLGLPAIKALNLVKMINESTVRTPVEEEFPDLFEGLGTLGEPYEIKLKPGAKSYSLFTPRKVPIPLLSKTRRELDRMEKEGIISKVEEPTSWCSGIVVILKKSGDVRICVDLRRLNEFVERETYPLPAVDTILAQVQGAKFFTKLDANSGFWQIPLAENSKKLTTFITPFGRYCFNKLPFGISSAPEQFQRRMSQMLAGFEGVQCLIDDVLVTGTTKDEHDHRLRKVLSRLQEKGVTLNQEKCQFSRDKILFLGHLIDSQGIQTDPSKTATIAKMKPPTNITELRRFLGMVNQLGKFTPNLAEITQPLRELLSKKSTWHWDFAQVKAFQEIKDELCKPTILALYDLTAPTKVVADASSFGLGAVLMQKKSEGWKPVVYASRTMTETERQYAQIEKEALATTWACERFAEYIIGTNFQIETDHKPLVPLLGKKPLDSLPPRVLRFRLRLARFNYTIQHVPGKLLQTADALSRSPTDSPSKSDLEEEAEVIMELTLSQLPASSDRLQQYTIKQRCDNVVCKVIRYCHNGWPDKHQIEAEVRPYWNVRADLTLGNNPQLLLYGKRIVVPKALQKETLEKIHAGHQGIVRCQLRAAESVWWPGISQHIKDMIHQCPECLKEATNNKEPLITTPLPKRPWQRVASDLFYYDGKNYLIVIDYFSRYPEVVQLTSTTSANIIKVLKMIFACHGVPEEFISDNGPQYASQEFAEFSKEYSFIHKTSSPHYAQSNGLAERMVRTAKDLLKKSSDFYRVLLEYRNTPLSWCKLTPTQLLMGRKARTLLPTMDECLIPQWPDLNDFKKKDSEFKRQQKCHYDRRHRTSPLPILPDETKVWISTGNKQVPGRVLFQTDRPRSYIVQSPEQGKYRRNRYHLRRRLPDNLDTEQPNKKDPNKIITRTQSGCLIKPPERFDPLF